MLLPLHEMLICDPFDSFAVALRNSKGIKRITHQHFLPEDDGIIGKTATVATVDANNKNTDNTDGHTLSCDHQQVLF